MHKILIKYMKTALVKGIYIKGNHSLQQNSNCNNCLHIRTCNCLFGSFSLRFIGTNTYIETINCVMNKESDKNLILPNILIVKKKNNDVPLTVYDKPSY